MASNDQNMFVHLLAGGIAGSTGAVLTSPLEVMKVRFQADSRSYKKYSCASRGATSSSVSGSSNGSSSASGGGGGGGGTAHLKSTSSCLHTSTSAAAHHHASTSSASTKSGLKSYVNILLRNNHGNLNFELNHHPQSLNSSTFQFVERPAASYASTATATAHSSSCYGRGILLKFRSIVENEGFRALFKGLGPNIVGVVPYRAIYFFSYANSKSLLYSHLGEEGPLLHIGSAFVAGFAAVTITNPIWFIKTRLQVDETRRGKTTMEVINKILKEKGPLGFYKGISASYFGITESALYFVIYEKLKSMSTSRDACSDALPITCYLTSAGSAKTLASCICYPHEVARTRLRLEGDKYRSFFQTLNLIIMEEGVRGIYKGMATHMIRQIPNTVIVMTTYELIINYWRSSVRKCQLIDDSVTLSTK